MSKPVGGYARVTMAAVLAVSALVGVGMGAVHVAAATNATQCTPNVNGTWMGTFQGGGTHGNGAVTLVITQKTSLPPFEWVATTAPNNTPIAAGHGVVHSDMTFHIEGNGTEGSFLKKVKADGTLMGSCQAPTFGSGTWSATYTDGTPPDSGMVEISMGGTT